MNQVIPASYPLGAAWHVVYCNIRAENTAREGISALGFDTFLPIETVKVIRRRQKHLVERPLFSRYLFAKFDVERDDWGQITDTDGVEDILRNNQLPVRVPEGAVNGLKVAQKFGLFDRTKQPMPFKEGEQVSIQEGPFSGFLGKVVKARSGERVEILLDIFGSVRGIEFPLLHLRSNQI